MRRLAAVATFVAVLACGACSGGSARAGRSNGPASASFVARYYAGAAHLVWGEEHGSLRASMDLTRPGPNPSAGLVQQHLDLGIRVDGDTVTLTLGSDTPWTGTLDGKNLVLTWVPDGGNPSTTTFTPGDTGAYESAARDASAEYRAQQQAAASRAGALGAAQAAKEAQALAAHQAQVAATRAAHDAKVAAMRAAHDAQVAAMQQRQAAARANAAAHHHP